MDERDRAESSRRNQSNGKKPQHRDPKEVTWKERISHFTWSWFECTMATGAMATLLAQQPFKFDGLLTIGKIFFILDLVLFVAFSTCITARFIMNPGTLGLSLHHPRESFFFGTFWVSIAFIIYSIELYAVPVCGPWLIRTLEILFWIYAGCAILVVVFQYHVIFDEECLPVAEAMPAWLLPAYPFLVLGPLAAVLEHSQPQDRGLPMMIGGITFQGLGWSISFIMYTIYFIRLINGEIPSEKERPAMYLAVGPAAYTSNMLVALGNDAPQVIPADYLSIGGSVPTGDVWKAAGVPAGIFLWFLGFWFFALTSVSVIYGWKKMEFSLVYWSFIFPQVGLTIAAIQIGNVLQSDGIKGVTSAMTILLVIGWLVVAAANIKGAWSRKVLWPEDEDVEDMHARPADEEFAKQRRD
ncbi:C4-dicarboxylate transporter/malic acid transport protein-like protein [Macrophomina phaseolina]|uniref:C4-dicarboxylate transporter/malic acid transport protein-like protein n=1 Tax=Macrophomina phaseolina TaxID=35725 RepID=A0ABQ8GH24_9PEZI|nr:C4-dicarboxylate transporter/malic acid transport protein-like protein [Macrophomina phaseolina]